MMDSVVMGGFAGEDVDMMALVSVVVGRLSQIDWEVVGSSDVFTMGFLLEIGLLVVHLRLCGLPVWVIVVATQSFSDTVGDATDNIGTVLLIAALNIDMVLVRLEVLALVVTLNLVVMTEPIGDVMDGTTDNVWFVLLVVDLLLALLDLLLVLVVMTAESIGDVMDGATDDVGFVLGIIALELALLLDLVRLVVLVV